MNAPITYRGWNVATDFNGYVAIGPNYDASYEGPEDGWIDNGQRVFSGSIDGVKSEIDGWIETQLFEALNAIVQSGVALTQAQRIDAVAAIKAAQVAA